MSKIQVRSFRNELVELRSRQKKQESTVDVSKLESRVGRLPSPDSSDLNSTCSFFTDPTLFAMVKQYHQKTTQGSRSMNQSRIRSFDDQWIGRRPQAKDVLPYRTLHDYDEGLIQQQHNNNDNSLFLNPLVPKRRRYLAQENQSNLLSSLSTIPGSPSSSSKRPKTTHDTQENDLMERLLHPESTMTQRENHDDDTQIEDDDDETTQQSQHEEEDNNEPSTSEIPETELMQQYHDFIQNFKDSPLHSLKSENGIDLLPRQRERLNYAKLNKKMYDKSKDTNESQGDEAGAASGEEVDRLDAEGNPEVVLTIATYHPLMPSYRVREFDMLGSQTLTDLRDFIFCIKDFVGDNDRKGKQPDGIVLNTQKKKLSASCLFIEGVFYVDTRAVTELGLEEGGPDLPDYSEPIRKWVMDFGRYEQPGLAEYQRHDMQGVTFEDLSLELNKPYLFLHQDGCQHVIMVRDIRIHSKHDPPLRSSYPMVTYNWQFVRYKCRMCNIYPAAYMTVNDVMSGSSPCFFCKECYKPFHFDEDGNQVLSHQVTQYFGM
ncbi:hypothetical protein O0I10_004057 [Lichtheimia ornata]|uniref:snRNA-activating protein complex subunit 3 n=1 Tax=Lichtheimia ornata TaxID=688661 RepID=A0AAD7V6F8_9FUNG|nr:uncharacterized protein O0I10_004057 [Lichtheimia ornata]KAJ8660198.1 hypothetical protein O0I10_004057 [Lichtheimia ornata]